MDEPQKTVYFSDAIFLGGAEEYLKLLVPEIDRERYEARVVLCDRPATRPLATGDALVLEGVTREFGALRAIENVVREQ